MKRFIICIVTLAAICSSQALMGASLSVKAPKSVELASQSVEPYSIQISCKGEEVEITPSAEWFGVSSGIKRLASKTNHIIKIWAEPNFSTSERSAVLTLKGLTSGKVREIIISQPPYLKVIKDGFPMRMEAQKYDTEQWQAKGVSSPKGSSALFSAVNVSGNTLTMTNERGATIAGMGAGDYYLFAVPVTKVEAGEQFDFMCTMTAMQPTAPKYWIFEYWDCGQWKSLESTLRTAEEDSSIRYSFYNKHLRSAHNTTFAQTFHISQPIENGCVKVRLRALTAGEGKVKLTGSSKYISMQLLRYNNSPQAIDNKRMLFIGNSFTYFYGTPFMFKEIARSEGHQVDIVVSVKGGQEFCEHLELERSREAIMQGGFDYAFLQDTSPNAAKYADTQDIAIINACREINNLTMQHSPSCQIIYEHTWGCPYDDYRGYGSYERLERLLEQGAKMLAEQLSEYNIIVSPIGKGFTTGREQNLKLLHSDNRHQSREGAYMKACINYLLIYKQPFTQSVSDCGVKAQTAQIIRDIAEHVVLAK